MSRITIDLDALRENVRTVDRWVRGAGARWTFVSKALCGHVVALRALDGLGIRSVGDSRLENLGMLEAAFPGWERWYLRLPALSEVAEVVDLASVSLDSEPEVLRALDQEAGRRGRRHRSVLMVELGDLREGVLPGRLVGLYAETLAYRHLDVIGIGTNLGCISGVIPSVEIFHQLALYRELLELKYERRLPILSAGSSIVLPLLLRGELPPAINHFRIGEALFLGTNLVEGGFLPELRDDVVEVEAEIVEIAEKPLAALGEAAGETPFESLDGPDLAPGQRGLRAVLALGQVDTEVGGLVPLDRGVQLAGASSDLTVVNLAAGGEERRVGHTLRFRPSYGALVRLMASPYVERRVRGSHVDTAGRVARGNSRGPCAAPAGAGG